MSDHQQSVDGLRAKMAAGARRKVVCLIGSCRFYPAFQEANFRETMAGNVVLSVGFYPGAEHGEGVGITPEEKLSLDALHKDKIALADEVLVLNVGGYLGDSTRAELAWAVELGRPVRWLVPQHCYTNGVETVVAVSIEHARAVLREQSGGDLDEVASRFHEILDSTILSVGVEDPPPPSEACCLLRLQHSEAHELDRHGHSRRCPVARPSKTCREWASTEPPSVLCSTEF